MKLLSYVSAIVVVITGTIILETRTEKVQVISDYLRVREIDNGLISYSYITMFVVILTMSSIIFAIIIGMSQNMSSKLSYQSYDKRILKDRASIIIFVVFGVISFIQLSSYLFIDFTIAPFSFTVGLLVSFLVVISLITYLYHTLFTRFSIYEIVDDNYRLIHFSFVRLRKIQSVATKKMKSLEKISKTDKLSGFWKFKQKRLEKEVEKLKMQRKVYDDNLAEVVKEYSYILVNSYTNSDMDLFRYILKYVTKIGIHRFDEFGSTTKENDFLGMIGFNEQYDKFIEGDILPFYNKVVVNDLRPDFVKICNDEFINLINGANKLKYNNADNYNLTFYLICIREMLRNRLSLDTRRQFLIIEELLVASLVYINQNIHVGYMQSFLMIY
ncbi:hypothetical protein DWB64_18600 [Fusibacter sp. A1]|nr:hypothetical protein DWB64_18600 [Fusibacter sp. A1]